MKITEKIYSFLKDDLIKHTTIVFIGTGIAGICNLLYHLISVRLLTPEDYGTFNALISLIMLTSIVASPLAPTVVRFFSEYIAKKQIKKLYLTFKKLIKRLAAVGAILFLTLSVFSSLIADFLKTEPRFIVLTGAVIGVSFISLLIPAFFQSFQKFKSYTLIGISSSAAKLIIGTMLMYVGLGVAGGLSGFFAGPIVVFSLALLLIPRFMIKGENSLSSDSKKPDSSKIGLDLSLIYKYFFPVAVSIFSFIFLTNIDVILVKHLFSPENAGFYSIAQIIGKVFLYLPSALAIVMFPKSTTAYVKNSHSHHILYKSLLIAAGLCGAGVIICYLFPEFVLDTLTNRANPVSLELVTLFSLAMSFYAFVWIVVNYMLSTHNLKFVLPLLILAILEGVAIYIWHADLKVVLYVLLSFSIISFLMLFFMSKRINHKRRKLELT